MHVMRDTEAWLSWLEHTVHIREVTGSSPVASTICILFFAKDFFGVKIPR